MSTALLHLVAVVLVFSGLDKVRAPRPATEALRDARVIALPGRLGAVVPGLAIGAMEVAAGGAALALGGQLAAAVVATVYLGFAAFVLRLRSEDRTAGCGCFGSASTPPGPLHVALNLGAAGAAVAAVVHTGDTLPTVLAADAGVSVPYAVLLLTGGALVLSGPSLFAELRAARSGTTPRTFTLDT